MESFMNSIPGLSSRSLWSSQTKQNIKTLRMEGGVDKLVQSKKLSLKDATKLATKAFNSSLVFQPGERKEIINQLRSELGKQKEAVKEGKSKDNTEKRLSKTDFFQKAIPFLKRDSAADHKKIEADLNMLEALAENSVDVDLLSSAEIELKQIKAAVPKMDAAEKKDAYRAIAELDSKIQPDKILNTRGAQFISVRKLLDEQKANMQEQDDHFLDTTIKEVEKRLLYLKKHPEKSADILEDLKQINQILDDNIINSNNEKYKNVKENLIKATEELHNKMTQKEIQGHKKIIQEHKQLEMAEEAVDAVVKRGGDPVQMRKASEDLDNIEMHLVQTSDAKHPKLIGLRQKIDINRDILTKKINDEDEKIGNTIRELKKKISDGLKTPALKEDIEDAKESYSQLIFLRKKLDASDNKKMSGQVSKLILRINKHPNFKNLE